VPTTAPLVLSVEKSDGTVLTEIKLPLSISRVEDTFRHVDLTGAAKNYDGTSPSRPETPRPTSTGEPSNYGFGDVHSAEFLFSIQQTRDFYDTLLLKLRITVQP
jgi:hypothetical protein